MKAFHIAGPLCGDSIGLCWFRLTVNQLCGALLFSFGFLLLAGEQTTKLPVMVKPIMHIWRHYGGIFAYII